MQLKVDFNRQGLERLRSAADLLVITAGDLQGPVLTRVAQEHRKQESRIFTSEGAEGQSGAWPRLSPAYAERKRQAMLEGREIVTVPGFFARLAGKKGRKLKGKERTAAARALGRPISMKILVWSGEMRDRFLRHSHPANIERFVQTGPNIGKFQLGAASEIAGYHFDGNQNLPRRDMISKTKAQYDALLQRIVDWYQKERIPQAQRALRAIGGGTFGGRGGAVGRAAAPSAAP